MPGPRPPDRITQAIVAAVVAASAGCERPPEAKPAQEAQAVTRVEVVMPTRHTVRRLVGAPGQLVAFETTPIHAKIAGYVRKLNTHIGYEVKKGDVLAELHVPELEAEFRQKSAAVEQSLARKAQAGAAVKVAEAAVTSSAAKLSEVRAGVRRVDADLSRWQQEYRRVEQLVNERAQTGTLLDETRSKLRSSESSRDEERAKVKSAEAALVESRALLDQARSNVAATASAIEVAREDARRVEAMVGYSRIEAPYDGIITRRDVDTGHLTRPGSDAPPLFVVARTDVVTVVIDVPETYAADVDKGDRATVKLQALKGRSVEGTVTRTAWALDPRTRTIRAEIDIPNPGGKLRPGLYAYATVIVEEHGDVMTIPTSAVIPENDRSYCVVVVEGKALRKPIETGIGDGRRTEVVSGLAGGEAVVKANASSLSDGMALKAVDPVGTSPSGK